MKREKTYFTDDEKSFYDYIETLTDRELQEKQALYLRDIQKNTLSTKNNVQFFFYFAMVSLVLSSYFVITATSYIVK
jgi:5-formaminoimidazole-4-carboxamide-1-beta-D-ribofuranosyl 5'-monophosphate synthetase